MVSMRPRSNLPAGRQRYHTHRRMSYLPQATQATQTTRNASQELQEGGAVQGWGAFAGLRAERAKAVYGVDAFGTHRDLGCEERSGGDGGLYEGADSLRLATQAEHDGVCELCASVRHGQRGTACTILSRHDLVAPCAGSVAR
jgi:hypothetical protein